MGEIRLPEAFLEKMKMLLGEEYEAFLASYETERVQGLRFNPLKGEVAELAAGQKERFGLTPVLWCPEGYYYDRESRPGRHPLHEAGLYYIQEPSAMSVAALLDPQPGERVLDLCAAPGGKTTQIAGRLAGRGLLVSNEIHPARAKILSQNVERMGIGNAVVTNEDSVALRRYFPEFFDCIVVDAPCSGEGMFRKDEQARAEWSPQNVQLCAGRQQEILDNAAEMLRPGGRLVYSTCTFSPEEDEDGMAAFLERHPEFSVVKTEEARRPSGLSAGRPEWARGNHPELADTFRIWPHKTEGEGHYLALLEKAEEAGARSRRRRSPKYWQDKAGLGAVKEFLESTLTDIHKKDALLSHLVLFGENVYRLPDEMPEFDGMRVLRPGLHLGTLKKKRFEPSHALALYLRPDDVKQSISLEADGQQILDYLRGNTIPDEAGRKGWTLVCADGYAAGWAKAASGILKNHYPKGLRI